MSKDNNISLENVSCCLGCVKSDEVLFSATDLLHDLPGEYDVVKCHTCGLMRTNPRPTPDSISIYYPDNYGPYLGSVVNSDTQKQGSRFKQRLKSTIKKAFNSNSIVLPPLKPSRMLEIGCASGSFLHQMANKGWQVEGIELSKKAAKEVEKLGYPVYAGALETAPKPEKPFDLIVGWMVLEHLHEPINALKKLQEWSNHDAYLLLSIPNAGSVEFTLFKDKWYALQLPTHLHHFTPQSVGNILQASGWQIEKIYHQRTLSNFIGSLGYVLRDKGYTKLGNNLISFPDRGGLLTYALYPLSYLLSFFGQTGRMTVWARKL